MTEYFYLFSLSSRKYETDRTPVLRPQVNQTFFKISSFVPELLWASCLWYNSELLLITLCPLVVWFWKTLNLYAKKHTLECILKTFSTACVGSRQNANQVIFVSGLSGNVFPGSSGKGHFCGECVGWNRIVHNTPLIVCCNHQLFSNKLKLASLTPIRMWWRLCCCLVLHLSHLL